MIILTIWVAHTALRIEILNARSGYYLPRKDGGADGKWRQSALNTPRDRLRDWVGGPGLLQYVLTPVLLVLCWPVAILALLLYPFVWLILLPFRLLGIAFEGILEFIKALVLLPSRLLNRARG